MRALKTEVVDPGREYNAPNWQTVGRTAAIKSYSKKSEDGNVCVRACVCVCVSISSSFPTSGTSLESSPLWECLQQHHPSLTYSALKSRRMPGLPAISYISSIDPRPATGKQYLSLLSNLSLSLSLPFSLSFPVLLSFFFFPFSL